MANFGNVGHFGPKIWPPNVALKILLATFLWDILNLQCSQDQKSSKVDPNDHVEVVLVEDVHEVADEEQDDAGDEDGEDVAEKTRGVTLPECSASGDCRGVAGGRSVTRVCGSVGRVSVYRQLLAVRSVQAAGAGWSLLLRMNGRD